MEISKGKLPLLHKCSVPNRAMLFSLYNHSQRLWERADGTSISTMNLNLHVDVGGRGEASIKWRARDNLKGVEPLPPKSYQKRPPFLDKFSSSLLDCDEHHINCYPCTKTQLFDPLSTIYCTGFTSPRSHTSWA